MSLLRRTSLAPTSTHRRKKWPWQRSPQAVQLLVEALEDRTVPSASPTPLPVLNLPEAASGPQSLTHPDLEVALSSAPSKSVTVQYAVTGGTAVKGTDFTLASGTLTFTVGGPTHLEIPNFTVVNHGINEPDKTIQLTLTSPTNAYIDNAVAVYTIKNDQSPPTVSFDASDPTSGNPGQTVSFNVSLASASGKIVTVPYSITGGTAVAGVNYKATSGTLTFAPGQLHKSISVPFLNDQHNDSGLTAVLGLGTPTNATLGANSALTYTLTEPNANLPTVSFSAAGESGPDSTTSVSIPVTLSAAASSAVTVHWAAGGTAKTGSDFSPAAGTITIPKGSTTANLSLNVVNHSVNEADKTIKLTLSSPSSNAFLGNVTANTYTIHSHVALPNVAFVSTDPTSGNEGTSATIKVGLFDGNGKAVTSGQAVTVPYTIGGSAVAGTNFKPLSGTVTVPAGQSTANITLSTLDDHVATGALTVQLDLGTPTGANLAGSNTSLTYSIQNVDKNLPIVGFASNSIIGQDSTTSVSIPVNLSFTASANVTVHWAVTGGTAKSPADFSPTSGTVTIPAGSSSGSISLTVTNHAVNVADKTIQITLSGQSSNAFLGTTQTTYTIRSHVPPPQVAFVSTDPTGSNEGTSANLAVGLFDAQGNAVTSGQNVTVHYTVAGSAKVPANYTALSGTVTIPAGKSSANIALATFDDHHFDGPLTVQLSLSSATNATLASSNTAWTYTLNEIDAKPTVAFTQTTGTGVHGQQVNLPVSLSATSGQPVTVDYAVTAIGTTAVSGVDYTLASGTLTINPNTKTQTLPLTLLLQGAPVTTNKTLVVTLSNASGATLGTNKSITVTILADKPATSFDLAPPVIHLQGPASGLLTNQPVTITGQVTDNFSGVKLLQASVDGQTFANVTVGASGHFSFAPTVADGSHTVVFKATDNAGNVSPTSSFSFTLDTHAPDTTIDEAPSNPTSDLSADFAWHGADPASNGFASGVDHFVYQLDNNTPVTTTDASVSGLSVAEGSHTFTVYAVDAAGNADPTPATFTWTVDATAPTAAIDSHPANPTNQTSAGFTFHGSDPVSGGVSSGVDHFVYQLDGQTAVTTSTGSVSGLSVGEGSHTFAVFAVDRAGNESDPVQFTWTVDTTAPDTGLDSSPANPTNSTSAAFTWHGSDATSGGVSSGVDHFVYQLDNNNPVTTTATSVSNLAVGQGSHTFTVYAVDKAGNKDATPASFTWVVDTATPAIHFTSPASGQLTNNGAFTINGSISDALDAIATFQAAIDGGDYAAVTLTDNTFSLPVSLSSDGPHAVHFQATDQAGNSSGVVDFTVTVDTTAPTTSIDTTPASVTNQTSAGFTWHGTDPQSNGYASGVDHFVYQLDNGAPVTTTSTSVSGLAVSQGSHTFSVYAVDKAGNADPRPATFTWTVDTALPVIQFTSPASGRLVNNGAFTILGTVSDTLDSVVSVQVAVDGGGYAPVPLTDTGFSYAVNLASDGPHTIHFQATDQAGNISAVTDFTVTVDTTAPDTAIDTSPASATKQTSASFTWHGSDATSNGYASGVDHFVYQLDGNDPVSTTGTSASNLSVGEGSHTFTVYAVDKAGNVDATPATFTWTVDTTAPDTFLDSSPANPTNSTSAAFTWHGSDATSGGVSSGVDHFVYQLDNNNPVTTTATSVSNLAVGQGSHTFTVYAVDRAGNQDATPASFTWVVDTTAPAIQFTSPASGQLTNNGAFTINGSISDALDAIATFQAAIDGGDYAAVTLTDNTFSLPVSFTTDGPHTIHFQATDQAGNSSGVVDFTVTVDTTAPTTSIDTTPASVTNQTTAGFTFHGTDPQSNGHASGVDHFVYQLDSGAPVTTTATSVSGLSVAEGSHTFSVYAVDKAGNADPHPATFTWTVDTTAPDTALDTTPASLTTQTSAGFTWHGSDKTSAGVSSGVDHFVYQLDNQTPVSTTDTSLSNLSVGDGSHTFTVYAVDGAGNADATPATFTWTVDATPPDTFIDTHPPAVSSVATASFTFHGSDATSGVDHFVYQLDSNDPVTTSAGSVSGLSVGDGDHTFTVYAVDAAGNADPTPASFAWHVDTSVQDNTPPETFLDTTPASLTNQASAGFTFHGSDPVINGVSSGVDHFVYQLDNNAPVTTTATSVSGLAVSEGSHTFTVYAVDAAGNADPSPASFTWTVDTTPPATPVFDLATGTADLGPETTSATKVTLVGQTEAGAMVALLGTGLTAKASGTGAFQIPGVSLALGQNTLTVQATDAAGNTSQSSLTVTRQTASNGPNAVIIWNQTTLNAIQTDATDPLFASRALAMVQAAVYDAVNAIEGTPTYYVKVSAPAGASVEAAVDQAAHDVLVYLYPGQKTTFDNLLATRLGPTSSYSQSVTDGVSVGQQVAAGIIALRVNDGSLNFVDFTSGTAPGQWQPTPPAYALPLEPQWANVTPFAMTSPSQFASQLPGPPALNSPEWAAAVNQTKALGEAKSDPLNTITRTADQTQIAQFWNDAPGTNTPPGHWNAIAQTVSQMVGNSIVDDARLFAELDVALADAGITAWNAKYTFDTWRPITVIQNGGAGVNSSVTADPNWFPLLTTPNFPEYVSGHSTFSAAAATILDSFFGNTVSFTTTEPTLTDAQGNPIQRSFSGQGDLSAFDVAAQEAGMSRIYAGIHFTFSNTDGQIAGKDVANWVLRTFDITQDTIAPKVSLDKVLPSGATNQDFTITGHVTDNLSGVASLQVQVDGGSYVPVSLGANGSFSFPTTFVANGAADGQHTLNFVATDAAGNVSSPASFSFVLATHAPTLSITSPADQGTLAQGSLLTGSVATSGGAAIVALNYAFDGGQAVPMAFGGNGSFSQALDLSKLGAGQHTLVVTVTDAAGNITSNTLHLSLAAAIPLQVTSLTPANGAVDVGVTYRPRVTFSRPIDTATLTSANFYATDAGGNKLPATIVPADDGTYAWLFLTSAMPGGSNISVTVDGSTIKSANDADLLDAASSGTPGSKLVDTFTTVSDTFVPGTTLSGTLADPGPDLKPMTRDDVRNGPDGVLGTADDIYLRPIQGVKVYILGHEDQAVYTDANGHFTFTSIPSGDVKVEFDGNVPGVTVYDPAQQRNVDPNSEGFYFPVMVMDLTIKPGVANTVMGTMGTPDEQAAGATNQGVYLPRIQTSILQPIASTGTTTVGLSGGAAPDLTPQQQDQLKLTVGAGTAVGPDGQKMNNAQIGVSVVPPELVKDMLPAGVLQHTFDITIQAPGVATFSAPAQLTFPNIFNSPPGTKLEVLSFDHTTGRLVIDGTATVSADGLSVVTDPGTGVTAPGWHGLTPPGTPIDTPPPPCPVVPAVSDSPPPTPTPHVLPLLTGDTPTPDQLNSFSVSAPDSGYIKVVSISVDSQLQQVLQQNTGFFSTISDFFSGGNQVPVTGGEWVMSNSDAPLTFNWAGISDAKLKAAGLLDKFAVYGGVVTVDVTTIKTDGDIPDGRCPPPSTPPVETVDKFFIYRYLNPVYASQTFLQNLFSSTAVPADTLPFPDAVEVGPGGSSQTQTIDLHISAEAAVTPSAVTGLVYSAQPTANSVAVTFTPLFPHEYQDQLQLRHGVSLNLDGNGVARQILYVNEPALVTMLTNIAKNTLPAGTPAPTLTPDEVTTLSTPQGIQSVADAVYNMVVADYGAAGSAIDVESGAPGGSPGLQANYITHAPGQPGLYGSVGSPWGSGIKNLGSIQQLVASYNTLGETVEDYLLPQAINNVPSGWMSVMVVSEFNSSFNTGLAGLEQLMSFSIAHELGHAQSLVHIQGTVAGGKYNQYAPAAGTAADIMSYDIFNPPAAGFAFVGTIAGTQYGSLSALLLGLDQTVTPDLVNKAVAYYQFSHTTGNPSGSLTASSLNADPSGTDFDAPTPLPGKFLIASDATTLTPITRQDFGPQTVAGRSERDVIIQNVGTDPVSISGATVAGSTDFSLVLPAGFVGQLAPGASLQIGIQYTPHLGPATGTVTIASNAQPITLSLTGQGTVAGPGAQVDATNDNLGGAIIGHSVTRANAIVVNNYGSAPLTITGVTLIEGNASFQINNLPADLANNPITIAPGNSYALSVTYTATAAGLQRGQILLATNDPNNASILVGVDGTGVYSDSVGNWGNDYIAIAFPSLGDNATIRLKSDAAGNFSAFLPPSTVYQISVFDPKSGMIAHGQGFTSPSGQTTNVSSMLRFKPSSAADLDGDGLPDDVEYALGTNPNKRDTSGTGIDDFTKLRLGLPLLGNQAAVTGVVASQSLSGEARAVTLVGAPGAQGQTAFVATGSYGLALVDVSNFQKPTLLGQVQLQGVSTDIAVDAGLQIAAVASNNGGLNIVGVSNPARPTLLFNVPVDAAAVRVLDGTAYVAVGSSVQAFDLTSGTLLQNLDLQGGNLTGLAIDGTELYTMSDGNFLHVVDIGGLAMVARGSLSLPAGGGGLFVGNGVAYVPAHNLNSGGFSAVNVGDPAHPTLIAGPGQPGTGKAGTAIVANGSGIGLLAGSVGFVFGGFKAVDVVSLSDLTNTYNFITRYQLPDAPQDVAIGEGIAFVADGGGGLQVVNYLPFDTRGVPPTASISLPASAVVGTDNGTPEVVEGSTIVLNANITDDVQVRDVQLLVNGQVVSNQVSFPYDLSVNLPTIAQNGSSTVTIQVLATDTGGNVGQSQIITVELVHDTIAPTVTGINVAEGSHQSQHFRSIIVQFSKRMDVGTLNANTLQLLGPGGVVTPTAITFRTHDSSVQLSYPQLATGDYQFVIDAADISDAAGNGLGNTSITRDFSVLQYSSVWTGAGKDGLWSNPANWANGTLPGANDDVLIDVPGNAPVTFDQGTALVRSVLATDPLVISGGTLTVAGTLEVDAGLKLEGGTLSHATVTGGVSGKVTADTYSSATLDDVTLDTGLTAKQYATLTIANGLTLNALLSIEGGNGDYSFGGSGDLIVQGTQAFSGSGAIKLGTVVPGEIDVAANADGSAAQWTINGITIQGQGKIVDQQEFINFVFSPIVPSTLINNGTIVATTAGSPLSVNVNLQSPGRLQAADKVQLNLGGILTRADLQNTSVTGSGQIWLGGDGHGGLDNTNKTLFLDQLPAWINFGPAGRIFGGTVSAGTPFTLGAGWDLILDGVTNTADITIPTGAALELYGNWVQNGKLEVTGGTLDLGGSFTPDKIGEYQRTGGTVNLTGTLVNTGNVLDLAAFTGSLNFYGGTIKGGTVTSTGSAAFTLLNDVQTASSLVGGVYHNVGPFGTLDGVTLQTDLTVSSYATLFITGGLELDAMLTVDGSQFFGSGSADLQFSGTQTVSTKSGAGLIALGTFGAATMVIAPNLDGSPATVTIASGVTLEGQGAVQTNVPGTQQFGANGTLDNQGTINVPAFESLEIDVGLHNTGQINVGEFATLTLGGSFTLADLQNINVDLGGRVVITGTLDNTGQTLDLNQLPGYLSFAGGTIKGGTVNTGGGTFALPAGTDITLRDVTITGDVVVGLGTTLTLEGAWTNQGTIDVEGGTLNLGGRFALSDLGTLIRNGGTVSLTGTLDASASGLALNASTGSWYLDGGTLKGGVYTAADGASLLFTSHTGTLDGVTLGSDLTLAGVYTATVNIVDDLTLADGATIYLGDAAGDTFGALAFVSTETLGGTGTVVFGGSTQNAINADALGLGSTLTIGAGITIRGDSGSIAAFGGGISGVPAGHVINKGTIQIDGSAGQGGRYGFDTGFSGNSYASFGYGTVDTSGVTDPAPQSVYQTYREGQDFTYTLGGLVAGESYTVRLDFADAYAFAGERRFNVFLNGDTNNPVLSDFDIAAAAGGQNIAVTETFAATADTNGQITLEFQAAYNGYYFFGALVNGIAVIDSADATVLAIDCGQVANQSFNLGSPTSLADQGQNVSTFENQGTISVSNGETLSINGSWTNDQGASISASGGATLNLGDQPFGSGIIVGLNGVQGGNSTGPGGFGPPLSPWSNAGTISSTDSTVNLGGLITGAGVASPHFTRSGGTVNLTGTLDASASGLVLDDTTGSWNLVGGTLKGGEYRSVNGNQLVFTDQGGYLDNVTLGSDLHLDSSYTTVHILDGLFLDNANLYLGSADGSFYSALDFDNTATLGGTGSVIYGGSPNNLIRETASGATLTIDTNVTIQGKVGALDSSGTFAFFGGSGAVVNKGTIDVDGTNADFTIGRTYGSTFENQNAINVTNGATLTIYGNWTNDLGATVSASGGSTLNLGNPYYYQPASWSNAGTISATDSTVNLGGEFTLGSLAAFDFTTSTINLVGTLDASSTGLHLDATTGSWNLKGGTLRGGELTTADGAQLVFTNYGGTLDNVTLGSDLYVTSASGYASIVNNLTLDHVTIYLGDTAGQTYGQLSFGNTESLTGTGTIFFGASGSNAVVETGYDNGSGDTLTIGPNITIRGNSGSISAYYNNGTVINQGHILADAAAPSVSSYAYDRDFSGGSTTYTGNAIDTSGVTDPAPQAVYQSVRFGTSFSYTLGGLVPGASYTVNLQFAEIYWDFADQRIFNVGVTGGTGLSNFDIFSAAGGTDIAVTVPLAAVADSSGQIVLTFTGAAGAPDQNAMVNGIELLDGSNAVVQTINCGGPQAGTFYINPASFQNQGQMSASNGETLSIQGAWTNQSGASITATGATLNLGDQYSSSTNQWSNAGSIVATNSTVNLGGLFTIAGLGTFTRSGGTVNLVGTLDASATGLALDATTGSWDLVGGTIKGGSYSASGGAELIFTNYGGTLDGVTANSDLDVASIYGAYVRVSNNLTLGNNATIYLGNGAGTTYGTLYFDTTETLGGTGSVVFGKSGGNSIYVTDSSTLTIGANITLRGSSGSLSGNGGSTIINQGQIQADDSGASQGVYGYDTGFSGGSIASTAVAADTSGLADPAPQSVYLTERFGGDFSYTISNLTPNASYTLRLDFADPDDNDPAEIFNVIVNGDTDNPVLSDFDIVAQAGGTHKAIAHSAMVQADASGQLVVEFQASQGYAEVSGIAVYDGGTLVQAINCGELAGGTITVNPSSFENQRILAVSHGETLDIHNLSGNVGQATLNDAGSQLSVGGNGYVINQGLVASAGQTVTLNGSWTNAAGSAIQATGATLNLGDPYSYSSNEWTNAGTISATNSTVNLGGSIVSADLGSFTRSGGTVNLVGTLDASATGLTLDATTGSWDLAGGVIKGGTYSATGGAELIFTNYGGTLDGVTANSDLDAASIYGAIVHVLDNLTLGNNATIYLGNGAGTTYGALYFDTTETLGGTGSVVFGKSGGNYLYETDGSSTLTIGPSVTVRGSSGVLGAYSTGAIVNQGQIQADDSGGLVVGFSYDSGFSGGSIASTAVAADTSGLADPAPQSVYLTERFGGDFSYTISNLTPNASYTLRLDFADPDDNDSAEIFNVIVNGDTDNPVLSDFDIVAQAGGSHKAIARSFTAQADNNGQIVIEFQATQGYAEVSGIEVLDGGTLVQGINCGQLPGGGLTINPGSFENQGTLAVSNNEAVNVYNLAPNAGTISVGAGSTLYVHGDFSNAASGVVNMAVGGTATNQLGVITVYGTATLDGTLNVTLANGFTPADGDSYPVMDYSAVSGQFATVNVPDLSGAGLQMMAAYSGDAVTPGGLTLNVGQALMLAPNATPAASNADTLTQAQLAPIAQEAAALWAAALPGMDVGILQQVHFQIANLQASYLGFESGTTIWISASAAGRGWFVDATPADSAEFTSQLGPYELAAVAGSAAAGKVDLLTTVLHEMGHVLGLPDADASLPHDVMTDTLGAGIRREIDASAALDALFARLGKSAT